MEKRTIQRANISVSSIGLGTWQLGADWGEVTETQAMEILEASYRAGVSFFDTADVYGDGRSERLVARLRREVDVPIVVATKAGRRAPAQEVRYYTPENLVAWVDRSRENLEMATLDLVQLHCPPTDLFYHPEVFAALDDLVAAGVVAHYGVSVERVEEALKAIDYPGVATVQIIYNVLRQRPAERFFPAARAAGVGVIVRVPLASGLLTGKITKDTAFAADDHRAFNRHGESFDVGETFAGVDLETGLAVVEDLRGIVPPGETLTGLALRFCLSDPAVSTVIPGARTPEQARDNAAAGDRGPLDEAVLEQLAVVYEQRVAAQVHNRW